MFIRIIAQNSGAGLRKDMNILASVLKGAGHQVEELVLNPPSEGERKWRNIYDRIKARFCHRILRRLLAWMEVNIFRESLDVKADINIFLEIFFPRLINTAKHNLLIPYQEWFKPSLREYLPWIDSVLCKTREAEKVFGELGCNTKFISFTSMDSFCDKTTKDFSQALHFAVNGLTKGTQALLNVWSKHPEWPDLWISQKSEAKPLVKASNIRYFDHFLKEEELPELQTRCGIYIGPSEAEGFGHALVEAMSAKAIVITTNAPPMNEVVRPERGFLAAYQGQRPHRLGTSYYVDEGALEKAIISAFSLSEIEKIKMGESARKWYLDNDKFFRDALIEALKEFQWLPQQQEERQLYGNAR